VVQSVGAFQSREVTLDIWGTNSTNHIIPVQLLLTAVDLKSKWTKEFPPVDHMLQPNASTDLAVAFPCPHPPGGEASDEVAPSCTVIVQAKLVAKDDPSRVLSRMSDWPQPYKFWAPPKAKLNIKLSGETISIKADVPVKGLILSVDEELESVDWSDNGVGLAGSALLFSPDIATGSYQMDLMPKDEQVIIARGLNGRKIKVAYMGQEVPTCL
jgi:beta-mannosidase